ncbi:predicted protein [Naegleria gruberi]|uniref:Predicted protein n=1 Tax=Naegleria gruberi TaxID=5762 RepID=D2V1H8_NAEGR|nr:uncharacterized protein NAEGRDRAFT_45892 [Naegleria gruberi]EFC49310.1 predicted protein [Naegleria gruberi]|eukprot:XP_002682054.1 predicted protein [Naegleria gruberi strain NEG-M]
MKNQNNNNNSFSFVDETKNIKAKVKVMKRNHQLNIRNTRLRQTLQHDKLLENYFEWDKSAPSGGDLTVYKIVTPPLVHADRNETNLLDSGTNPKHDQIRTCNRGVRNPSKKNRVVTSEKVQVKETNRKNSLVSSDSYYSEHRFSTPNSSSSSNTSIDPPTSYSNSNLHACLHYMQKVIGNYSQNLLQKDSMLINSSSSCSSVGQLPCPPFETNMNSVLPSNNIPSQTFPTLMPNMQTENRIRNMQPLLNCQSTSNAIDCWFVEDQQYQLNGNLHPSNSAQGGADDDCDSFLSSTSYE